MRRHRIGSGVPSHFRAAPERVTVATATGVLLAALTSGCTSLSRPSPGQGEIVLEIGVSTAADIDARIAPVLRRRNFQIVRAEGPPAVYFETAWQDRAPFHDETGTGVAAARSRVLIRGRERATIGTLRPLFTLELVLETLVRLEQDGAWIPSKPTAATHEYARGLAAELTMQLDAGVRRY